MAERVQWGMLACFLGMLGVVLTFFAFASYWSVDSWISLRADQQEEARWQHIICNRTYVNPEYNGKLCRVQMVFKAAEHEPQFQTDNGTVVTYEPFDQEYDLSQEDCDEKVDNFDGLCYQLKEGRKKARLTLPSTQLAIPIVGTIASILFGLFTIWLFVHLIRAYRRPQRNGPVFLNRIANGSSSHARVADTHMLLTASKVDEMLAEVPPPEGDVCVICLEEYRNHGGSNDDNGEGGGSAMARRSLSERAAAVAEGAEGVGAPPDPEFGNASGAVPPPPPPLAGGVSSSARRRAEALLAKSSGDLLRAVSLPCRHVFHYQCIKLWLLMRSDVRCPLCNNPSTRGGAADAAVAPADAATPHTAAAGIAPRADQSVQTEGEISAF